MDLFLGDYFYFWKELNAKDIFRFVEEQRILEEKLKEGVIAQQSVIEEKETLERKLKEEVNLYFTKLLQLCT